jgi:hypothetical protein
MSTQKIITINPDAFKFSSKKKTLKERKTKPLHDAKQTANANKLKKELLKKVKDYQKNKEVEKISEAKVLEAQAPNLFDSNALDNSDFEREFNKSLSFLHDLSKKNKEKKRKKTLKVSNLDVHIDIPSDNLIYTSNKEPNYGCLKNGTKPTFRDLVKTKKNNLQNKDRLRIVLENNQYYDHSAFHNKYNNEQHAPPMIDEICVAPLNPQTQHERIPITILSNDEKKESNFIDVFDNKINILNNMDTLLDNTKIKELDKGQDQGLGQGQDQGLGQGQGQCPDQIMEKQASSNKKQISFNLDNVTNPIDVNGLNANGLNANGLNANGLNVNVNVNGCEPLIAPSVEPSIVPKLCITTKTYKYKLGKNKERRQIGVLIKNRDTQKRIKKEIEKLKQEDIQTIKNYLREKGLIKLGSQAPTTILRKMYEDSILSGEINNNNSNNLVYNYLNT